MSEVPATRASLLVRLRDPQDGEAWRLFVRLYAPLIYQFGRRKGLQDADASDLTQEVLRGVGRKAGRLGYDPGQGTFRGWLFTLARRRLIDFWRTQPGRGQGSGDSATMQMLSEKPAPEEEDTWNADFQRRVFHEAAELIRPTMQPASWQAFWQTAVEGRPGQEVARELGMTVAAVYLAKSRTMARLKELVRVLSGEPDEGRE